MRYQLQLQAISAFKLRILVKTNYRQWPSSARLLVQAASSIPPIGVGKSRMSIRVYFRVDSCSGGNFKIIFGHKLIVRVVHQYTNKLLVNLILKISTTTRINPEINSIGHGWGKWTPLQLCHCSWPSPRLTFLYVDLNLWARWNAEGRDSALSCDAGSEEGERLEVMRDLNGPNIFKYCY